MSKKSTKHSVSMEHSKPVKILLGDDAKPYTVHTARRVPLPLLQKVKEELKHMEENEVIEPVTELVCTYSASSKEKWEGAHLC